MDDRYVVVVGAGPAGIFAAGTLAKAGVHVTLLNRDLRPGGLGEYGVYPDKHRFKEGLRKQFRKVLDDPKVQYRGGVVVGDEGAFSFASLLEAGADAVLVTVGAQGTKTLSLPGEEGPGVFHAKDFVYHYNGLPPFSSQDFPIGERVVVVGVGNVMVDVAHYVRDHVPHARSVTAVARRGPAERKYGVKDIEDIAAGMDRATITAEVERCAERMRTVGQDPDAELAAILSPKAMGPAAEGTPVSFRFFSQPKSIVRDEEGRVTGLLVENTRLEAKGDRLAARSTGEEHTVPADTVIFSIGDSIDKGLGLPTDDWGEIPAVSSDEEGGDAWRVKDRAGFYLAGWARRPSTGLVGTARKDATQAARIIVSDLESAPAASDDVATRRARIDAMLETVGVSQFTVDDVKAFLAREQKGVEESGNPEWRFRLDEEMRG